MYSIFSRSDLGEITPFLSSSLHSFSSCQNSELSQVSKLDSLFIQTLFLSCSSLFTRAKCNNNPNYTYQCYKLYSILFIQKSDRLQQENFSLLNFNRISRFVQ